MTEQEKEELIEKKSKELKEKKSKAASTGKSHEDFMKIQQEKEELEEKSNAEKKALRAKNRKINDQVPMELYSDFGNFETDDNDNMFWDSANRFKVDE